MLECHCENGMVISPAEQSMAKAEGLDPEYCHKFMDTWERHADRAMDVVDYDKYYDELEA